MNRSQQQIPQFGLFPSFLLFGLAGLILYLETHYLIPYLTEQSTIEMVIWWFIVAAIGMFIPLVIFSLCLLKREGWLFKPGMWKERLRFRKLTPGDWLWTLGGFLVIGALSFAIMSLMQYFLGETDHQPPFMQFEPLSSGRYWILLVWLPYWLFNILGEEILWRGVILYRQENSFGKYAWLINGFGWGVFHIAFGWQLLLTLLPILFVLPYLAQKRKNTWIAVIIHALLNGPSFIAIALGAI